MNAEKLDKMAKEKLEKEELEKGDLEKKILEKIPEFASYFWLGGKIREGQAAKGFMGLPDCELFLGSMQKLYETLQLLVVHEKNPKAEENLNLAEPTLADGVAFHAFHVLKTVIESLNGTGFLSIEDSVSALGHLKRIQLVLTNNIDPVFDKEQAELRLEEKKKNMQAERKPKTNKKKNNKRR